MSDAVQGVTGVDEVSENSSQQSGYDAYDWFYNPEYAQGINKGTSQYMDQVNQGSQEEQYYEQQVAEIWGGPVASDVKSF
ncbi:hypothetical protein [Simkania sp.]|uniref:hypothetical protein n=1 Tax=Simkania sp. TaxID=34094 RepID=UPI003B5172B7